MDSWKRMLLANQAWVQEKVSAQPNFFIEMTKGQEPEFLWIGCSDSRVPAEEVTGTRPGELFVHRNIANLVVHTDLNLLSVLQYAVDHLKVKHVIVCGHYGCGGVKAAMTQQNFGNMNMWLRHIKDLYRVNRDELDAQPDEAARTDRLVELNVLDQIQNLKKTAIIQRAWQDGAGPTLHGWVYGLHNGLLTALTRVERGAEVDPVYFLDMRGS